MAQQEDGWPLGLQPLNVRIGLARNRHVNNGSISFNTLLTGSPTSSTVSSSDLDSESIGSFFHDRSITLGTLLSVSSILELSPRSTTAERRRTEQTLRDKRNNKTNWLFSLCSKLDTDAVTINNNINNNTPSLGHFLQAERRAATFDYRRNQSPNLYGPDDFSRVLPVSDPNPVFLEDHVAPPPLQLSSSSWSGMEHHGNGCGAPLLLSCLCGRLTH